MLLRGNLLNKVLEFFLESNFCFSHTVSRLICVFGGYNDGKRQRDQSFVISAHTNKLNGDFIFCCAYKQGLENHHTLQSRYYSLTEQLNFVYTQVQLV